MDTTKVSLPPIRQMLYNLTPNHAGNPESIHVPPSLACRHLPGYQDKQLTYRQAPTMKHNNSRGVYTFDSWHEYLSTPPYLSHESNTCQCAPNGLAHASCFTNKYAHHQPESHRHRRAHSASYPPPYHQVQQENWRSPHRGRTRAHTTSGYLPSSPLLSSSSSSSSSCSLSPTNSTAVSPPAYYNRISAESTTHVSRAPMQHHRYHCPHCRKTFSRPSSLRIHIYSHTGEKPHVCPYYNCGRRFSVQSNMRRHIRVHVGNNDTHSQA